MRKRPHVRSFSHPPPARAAPPGDAGAWPPGGRLGFGPMPLSRISWIATVAICLVAAVISLVSGYQGYAAILVAVAGAAAINLA